MALASLNAPLAWPGICSTNGTPSLSTSATVASAGQYDGFIAAAEQDMTISHIGFMPGVVAGSATADCRIETVSAGAPSGTLWATNTNGISGVLSSGVWILTPLTAPASITKGQLFAVKLGFNAATSFATRVVGGVPPQAQTNLPYQYSNTGTPAAAFLSSVFSIALASSSTAFYRSTACLPTDGVSQNTFNNTSSARRGVRFQVPFKCRCVGMRIYQRAANGNYNAALFDDSGAELNSSSTAYSGVATAANSGGIHNVFFDNAVTLSPGTWYRAAIEPTSATDCSITTFSLPHANYRSAYPGGANFFYTTYVASSWTDTATNAVPMIDLLLDQLDDGASAGGGGAVVIGS
jgi:hypothetical protein